MATRTPVQPRIVGSNLNDTKTSFRGGPESSNYVEAAAAGFGKGDFIYLDSSGNLAICTVSSTVLNSEIAGMADSAAAGTGTKVNFPVIRPDTLIGINAYHSTEASSALAKTMLGRVCRLVKINSIWRVDVETAEGTIEGASASAAKAKIVDFIDPIGTVNGRVKIVIVPFSIETDGGGLVRNLQLA